jgi:hypothetical protein
VLEARDRLGGRVHTHTLAAPNGQTAQVLNCRLLATGLCKHGVDVCIVEAIAVCCADMYAVVAVWTFTCPHSCHAVSCKTAGV